MTGRIQRFFGIKYSRYLRNYNHDLFTLPARDGTVGHIIERKYQETEQ